MVSESISVAIMVVAGIIMASAIATTLLMQMSVMDNVIRLSLRNTREKLETSIVIVNVALNTSTGGTDRYFVIYLKNTGNKEISLNNVDLIDVYISDNYRQKLYRYNRTCNKGCWNYVEVIADGVWSKGETMVMKLYNETSYIFPTNVKVVLPNGVGDEYAYYG